MCLWLVILPLIAAGIAAVMPWQRLRPWLLPLVGIAHVILSALIVKAVDPHYTRYLGLDEPGRLVLLLISVLFLICSVYAVGYLRFLVDRPNRVFCLCLLLFLGTASLVILSRTLGLMWVAMEATTLSTAPLIYFKRTPRSIEATWKYLLICSVGIALALLGSFFMAYAAMDVNGQPTSLRFDDLLANAPQLSKPWLHVAFVLLLVGYGTKMGLAPMHTWKPDAYGEASGLVGALLAGGVTNCAFLALLRVQHICRAAGEAAYTSHLLILLGLISIITAAIFMIGQRDFKRLLAYSSIEHMGILALGIGVGGWWASFGAMLHMLNNGLTKCVLFLSAGNIQRAYDSKLTAQVHGAIRRLPLSGTMFLLGFLAITGSPPFGPFISQFTILNGMVQNHRFVIAGVFLLLLLIVFIGMGRTVLDVVQGRPSAQSRKTAFRDNILTGVPIVAALALVLLLGVHIPASLHRLLDDAAKYVENQP